ncbi:SGNH/GDSL hydrolase family protein [Herbiconiux sp. CPCC 205716]|uniref:SGNH/GDSL hydrolase family protein n=1 Tax=Herbiconiux gentiana TaxID=2970912 RepID=A0ABT2GM12_9MICO|nr:SGNH/GDSL hydrolase family protein [Herbiconiux gentiana]MCS5715969.1 SGNH/GDSL hydrolase family protein [Herbiconiux gentiana]
MQVERGQGASRSTGRAGIRRLVPLGLLVAGAMLLAGCSAAAGGAAQFGAAGPAPGGPWVIDSGAEAPPAGQRQKIVTIGDSIMSGNGLDTEEAWPAVLARADDWQLTNLSEDGSGFVQPGDDGRTFSEQVAQVIDDGHGDADAPALIIVSASSNDLGLDPGKVEHAAKKAFLALHRAFPDTALVGLSAIWGDQDTPPELGGINDAVRSAAEAEGARWIDLGEPLAGRFDLMQFDDTHPTAAGQRVLATAVDERLRSMFDAADSSAVF